MNTHQALEDDFKAPRVYGSAYGNHNFIVIFSNKTTAPSYTSIWWHEAAHIAYRKLNLSNKEELGLHALEWMKRQGGKFRDHYDTIINIYDKSSWATEATARMIQCVVEDNGVEKFLNADFSGNEKLSNLDKAIKNVIIYGKEEPTEYDFLRRAQNSFTTQGNNRETTQTSSARDGLGWSTQSTSNRRGDFRGKTEEAEGRIPEGDITRLGNGAVSDEGVTMASDPMSKAIGEPRYGIMNKIKRMFLNFF